MQQIKVGGESFIYQQLLVFFLYLRKFFQNQSVNTLEMFDELGMVAKLSNKLLGKLKLIHIYVCAPAEKLIKPV